MRLTLDCDYDRFEHLANYDSVLRQILGLSPLLSDQEKPFHYRTLSENVCHVDEELLPQITMPPENLKPLAGNTWGVSLVR